MALDDCRVKGGQGCEVIYSECSDPVFKTSGTGGGNSESGAPVSAGEEGMRWGAIAEESAPRAAGVLLATGVA